VSQPSTLIPIFMAPSNHLYDTTDYFASIPISARLGFERLVRQAGNAGINIILDGVFNIRRRIVCTSTGTHATAHLAV